MKLAAAITPASVEDSPRSAIIPGRIGVKEKRPNPMAAAMESAPAVAVARRWARSVRAIVMVAFIAPREDAHKPQILIVDVIG
ncbi:hypothetical protein GCM10007920_08750 [Ciceribacter naphthalenivorans]|uniref:Uncharacterized protein n=2 Tax=Alphaproteobacteria TaxID=28211 RepID=A0A512HF00_9HYPH|nr:hypothetical protein RNA01_09650 [Ciceribacter naphthalenivorans]GLR21089.1 hypothetical protein GCM10007920_08750 [Ciceribacter naphthalenivorans]GLT03945.1 hypothetical protein GCM10007926_08750 [Sphingomonas psychrolutea]